MTTFMSCYLEVRTQGKYYFYDFDILLNMYFVCKFVCGSVEHLKVLLQSKLIESEYKFRANKVTRIGASY